MKGIPSVYQPLFKHHQIKPRKNLGQHFLLSPKYFQKILNFLNLEKRDVVLEIGAGIGILTQKIADLCKVVIASEVDEKLVEVLKVRLAKYSNVEIVAGDVLKVDLLFLIRKQHQEKIKVFGNLPYNRANFIIRHFLSYRESISEMVVMVQREVAERIVAQPGSKKYGLLSLAVQYFSQPEILFYLPARCFFPEPKVESALLKLIPYSTLPIKVKDEKFLFKILHFAFAQRRKTVLNSLYHSPLKIIGREKIKKIITLSQISPLSRPEEISLSQYGKLSNNLYPLILNFKTLK
jgi:16S rRNA (adenine1518-N6/adenine1519-N6)-dimethyltransferase